MKPLHWFAIAGVLLVLAVGLMVMPTPGAPALECAEDPTYTSGWVDAEQDCPVSIESYEAYRQWDSGAKWDNLAGLVLLLGGLGAAGAGLVSMRGQRRATDLRPAEPKPLARRCSVKVDFRAWTSTSRPG